MTLVLFLALLQAGSASTASRAEAERLFAVGTELVAEGDTSGAVAAWQGAVATGWTSAAVQHNLGTVALDRGQTAAARLHLERAVRLDPMDDAIIRNLALARTRAGAPEPSPARRTWQRVVAVVRPLGLVALALALTFGALAVLLSGRRRVAIALGAIALVSIAAASAAVWERTRPLAVAMGEAAVVESPSPAAGAVGRLRPGETVSVGEVRDGWRTVRVGRETGWVRADAVAMI